MFHKLTLNLLASTIVTLQHLMAHWAMSVSFPTKCFFFHKFIPLTSCLHRTSMVSKHCLLFQLMYNNYKYYRGLKVKKFKNSFAPTCFGSHRNHPQGAVPYLAKNYNWYLSPSVLVRMDSFNVVAAYCPVDPVCVLRESSRNIQVFRKSYAKFNP
jgi:hypothetical protein